MVKEREPHGEREPQKGRIDSKKKIKNFWSKIFSKYVWWEPPCCLYRRSPFVQKGGLKKKKVLETILYSVMVKESP